MDRTRNLLPSGTHWINTPVPTASVVSKSAAAGGSAETSPVTITAPPVLTDTPTPSEIGSATSSPIEPPANSPSPHNPHRGVIQTEIISLVFKGHLTIWGDVVIRAGEGTGNLRNDGLFLIGEVK